VTCSPTPTKWYDSETSCWQIGKLCCQKWETVWEYHTAEESWRYTIQVRPSYFFFLPTLICFLLWFFSISSILLSISDFKKYWYINLGSFAGFYLTNTVQTTNIMSISLLKRKRLLLSQRRLKHQKVVCGTISL
jgi:hypothetical protein